MVRFITVCRIEIITLPYAYPERGDNKASPLFNRQVCGELFSNFTSRTQKYIEGMYESVCPRKELEWGMLERT